MNASRTSLIENLSIWWKNKLISAKVLIVIVFALTLIRIWLAVKTPLFLRGGWLEDDFLLTNMAFNFSHLNWLGDYNCNTFSKGIGFSIWLTVIHWMGIPYSLGLIILYILSFIVLLVSLYRLTKNYLPKQLFLVVYCFMLFNPLTFDWQINQISYRQGFYNALTLIILGSVVGCFADRDNKKFSLWIVLLCIGLPLFAITKEDSSWIYLFIIPAFIVLLVYFCKEHRNTSRLILKRFCVLALPFLLVIGTNLLWQEINYQVYGVRITTDRNYGNYSRFINSLYNMSENDQDYDYPCWVSFDAIDKAIDCSPSLQQYEDYINNDRLKYYSPEINSGSMNCYPADMVFWYFKWCFRSGGLYEKSPADVNDYFGKVCNELDDARAQGKISNSNKVFVSKSAGGLSKTQITSQLLPFYFGNLYSISTYKDAVVTVGKDDANIDVMNFMTNSTFYTYNESVNRESDIIIKIDNKIIKSFQIISVPIFYLGIICCLSSLLYLLIRVFRKDKESLQIFIAILGLFLIVLGYCFAISWFASGFGAYENGHLSDYFHFLYYAGNAEFVLFALRLLGIGSICRLLIKRCKVNKHQ